VYVVTSRVHGLQIEPTNMSHQTLFAAQQKPMKVQQIGKGTSLSQAPQPRRPLSNHAARPSRPERRARSKMPATPTIIGALLGLGTQMYSNALRKLPYMRRIAPRLPLSPSPVPFSVS
jgi:hypothetical protein